MTTDSRTLHDGTWVFASDDVDLGGIEIEVEHPVLVTGANGYVASWIVAALLHRGVQVHAAVRDPADRARTAHLQRVADASPGTLSLFQADLLTPGSYAEAMRGCRVVFHTASPFVRHVGDPQRDLVDPALEGTRNVLRSVADVASVTRVVVTSSIAAVFTDAVETERATGAGVGEDVWNETASLGYEPYNYSKTVAEREAWRLAEGQDRWRLVVINPALVIGPALNARPTSESFTIMRQLGGGDLRFGAPRLALAVVDVRDIARAQIAAAYAPDAQGRHIVAAAETDLLRLSGLLRPRFGATLPLPRWALPKPLFWAMAPAVGVARRYAAGNVGHTIRLDTTKGRDALGMRYRSVGESLNEMFAQMAALGMVSAKR